MPRAKIKITKLILRRLLIAGTIFIAAQSPYFWRQFYKRLFSGKLINDIKKQRLENSFYYLLKKGLIKIERKNKQVYISLTNDGEILAGKYQINGLYIKPQKKWDGRWRVIIFDIPEEMRIKREALRGRLKELGFYYLQKSVWICPYPCWREIKLLRDFFRLSMENILVLEVLKIENNKFLREIFKV